MDGSLESFASGSQNYTIDWKGKAYTISVDRLQPVYVLADFAVQPTRCTPPLPACDVSHAACNKCRITPAMRKCSKSPFMNTQSSTFRHLLRRRMRPTTPCLPCRHPLLTEFTHIRRHAPFADLHSSVHKNQIFLFSCTFLSVLCFIEHLCSVRNLLSAHASDFLQRLFDIPFGF